MVITISKLRCARAVTEINTKLYAACQLFRGVEQ